MEFIDLGRQYQAIKPMVDKAIRGVLDAHAYISGPEVGVLEEQLADFCGRKHCVACGSGTEALQIPLMMYGVGPGDAVFVPSFTFFSTAECVSLVGATPVFVEVDASFNIDCDDLENKIAIVEAEGSLRPRGIISVDLFGRSADYDRIEPLAKEHDLFLLVTLRRVSVALCAVSAMGRSVMFLQHRSSLRSHWDATEMVERCSRMMTGSMRCSNPYASMERVLISMTMSASG